MGALRWSSNLNMNDFEKLSIYSLSLEKVGGDVSVALQGAETRL